MQSCVLLQSAAQALSSSTVTVCTTPAGDLSVHSRLTHDSEDEPETPRGWPGSERALDPGQVPASPAAAGGRRPTLGRLSITGNHHHEVRGSHGSLPPHVRV